EDLADRWGVEFRPAPNRADGVALEPLTVAAAADAEDRFALAELGFEVQAVDESVLNRGFDWSGVDALYVGRRLSVGGLDPEARAALHDFVDSGAGVVGQGVHGAELNRALDLLEVRAVRGTEEA